MTTPKTRGRKSLCTPELTKRLCNYISDACTVQSACECEGISTKTFYEWLNKGEAGQLPYSKFRDAVTRAKGRFKARVCKSIIEDRDWRARLELISRIYPQEFGRTAERPLLGEDAKQAQPIINVIIRHGAETERAKRLAGDALPNGRAPNGRS